MQSRPHIDKMLSQGKQAFDRFKGDHSDRHALGKYQGIRICLQQIHLLDHDATNREEAGTAFHALSTYGDDHKEAEVPDRRISFAELHHIGTL